MDQEFLFLNFIDHSVIWVSGAVRIVRILNMDIVFNYLFRWCPKGFWRFTQYMDYYIRYRDQFGLIYYLAKDLGSLYLTSTLFWLSYFEYFQFIIFRLDWVLFGLKIFHWKLLIIRALVKMCVSRFFRKYFAMLSVFHLF